MYILPSPRCCGQRTMCNCKGNYFSLISSLKISRLGHSFIYYRLYGVVVRASASLSLSLSIPGWVSALSMCVPVCPRVSPCVPVCPRVSPCVFVYVSLSCSVSVCMSVFLYFPLSLYQYIYICLSFCMSVCLSVSVSISIYFLLSLPLSPLILLFSQTLRCNS